MSARRPRSIRFICCALAALAGFGLVAARAQAPAAPVQLGAGAVRVDLPAQALRDGAPWLKLQGLSAAKPPGVLFRVYLGLAAGEQPKADDPRFVGAISFYDAVRGPDGAASNPSASLDLGPTLARMRSAGLPATAAVTILPSGPPTAGSRPTIASIRVIDGS